MTTLVTQLPYFPDSAALFDKIADQPWAVFLDSGPGKNHRGRYDIISYDPTVTFVADENITEIQTRNETRISADNPFDLLRDSLQPGSVPLSKWPFAGGALGYFSYDLGRRIEKLPTLAEDDEKLPLMAVGIYDWVLLVDHQEQQSWLLGQGRDPRTRERWDEHVRMFSEAAENTSQQKFNLTATIESDTDQQQYAEAYHKVKRYIREGDCYQVNLAQRFSAPCEGDPWSAYQNLRKINPAPFAAYLNYPFVQVLSCSPERFLKLKNNFVETQPIKGTKPRSQHPMHDQAISEWLFESEKDRAENVMIVDLLRNDLSKSCALGSVKVPKLFEVQGFATVHHLVSTITGRLVEDHDALHLLQGCFPGGSITGAPKVRAMEIIEELERHRRGIYCGAIGYIGFDGNMDSNIAIRTLTHQSGQLRFWAGGGIVHDSTLEGEYQESFDKVEAMLKLFNIENVDR